MTHALTKKEHHIKQTGIYYLVLSNQATITTISRLVLPNQTTTTTIKSLVLPN